MHLFRYRTRPEGFAPDPMRPLRSEPVHRNEVRIVQIYDASRYPRWRMTMPIGTFRLIKRDEISTYMKQTFTRCYLVGEPALWEPLLVALEKRSIKPEIEVSNGFEYVCEQCDRRFLSYRLAGNRVRLCSNRCELDRRNTRQRRWREGKPADYNTVINAARTARRAEARSGRVCAHCGAPIEAARSTKRFCSDVCRVRHHREAPGSSAASLTRSEREHAQEPRIERR